MYYLSRHPAGSGWYNEHCYVSLLNFMMTDLSLNSPLLVGTKNNDAMIEESWMPARRESFCFNKVICLITKFQRIKQIINELLWKIVVRYGHFLSPFICGPAFFWKSEKKLIVPK